ncbi:MAG TPA: cytochrome c-type biogenesis protein CcmH [Acidobacteriaceae bacterium]|nr:cytochrome c-type biogenesis protein CcmH [Acidobacteriaceae bacterium]
MRQLSGIFNRALLRLWLQISVAGLLLVFAVGAGDTSARYSELGHQMICTCGCNQVLLECNHVGCTVSTNMESELRTALDRGESDHVILRYFVNKYGPTVLAAPTSTGFNRVAWIAPGIVFLLATLGTALLIRKWKLHTVAMPTETATDEKTATIRARIRRETEI